MDSLKNESISATNLYSYGPFTDAATRSLYTGRKTLDDFGYFFRLNTSPTNHFKLFHDNGYDTYGFYYPYYLIGPEIKKHVNHSYYISGFLFNSEWGGMFAYYADMMKKRDLTETEVKLLRARTKLMFECWIEYYKEAINNSESIEMIKDNIDGFDFVIAHKTLKDEYLKFSKNPDEYVKSFLKQGKEHCLASLDTVEYSKCVNHNYLKKIYKRHNGFFKRCSKANVKANFLANAPSFTRVLKGLWQYTKSRDFSKIAFLANYYFCLEGMHKIKRESLTKPRWQNIVSMRKQLSFAADVLKKRSKEDNPFYLSLHVLEPHHYLSCFSFDIKDEKVLDEEFEVLNDYLSQLKSSFVGNLAYYMSLRYVDYCIEKFVTQLKEMKLWDNTTLLLVADHGSSYSYYPLHGKHVNCFDDECYHVPMLIRRPGGKACEVSNYHTSQDVLPTLCDVVGIEIPSEMTGKSMLDKNTNNCVVTEYMGPGCPDMLNREIWFSARDDRFIVAYKVKVFEDFQKGSVCEVYDRINDPKCIENVYDIIPRSEIDYLVKIIEERHKEIQVSTETFLKHE